MPPASDTAVKVVENIGRHSRFDWRTRVKKIFRSENSQNYIDCLYVFRGKISCIFRFWHLFSLFSTDFEKNSILGPILAENRCFG